MGSAGGLTPSAPPASDTTQARHTWRLHVRCGATQEMVTMEPGEHYYGMGFHPNPLGILFGLGFMLLFWGLLFGIPAWFIVRRFGRNRWRAMAAPRYPTAQTTSAAPPAPS